MGFIGKVPADHPNMRTEFAWMHALEADHYNIHTPVEGYDVIVVIFPKGRVFLDACGSKLIQEANPVSNLLSSDLVGKLKLTNGKVFYMQEGPHWWFNDYELADQINFYNMVASCDGILAHNEADAKYYRGLYPTHQVQVMPTLMIDSIVEGIVPQPQEKTIIGGNFSRWYGGFESYMVAQEFGVSIWGQTSHARREGEDQLINHLPRVLWTEWMKQLSTFKYAVHLMPTVAAGTFSLNCAYFGIPCIGNQEVDTQRLCYPELSVDVSNLEYAKELANRLLSDPSFYKKVSKDARKNYKTHYNIDICKDRLDLLL